MKYIDDAFKRSSVFKDITKLDFDYVPKEIVHRDDHLRKLASIFKPVIASNVSQNVLITGSVGTGKTVMSKKFSNDFKEYALGMNKTIETIHVNCRRRKTDDSVLLKLVTHFQPAFPDRGFSVDEKLDTLKKDLEKNNCQLIVVLDEADVLIKKSGSNLIYLLTRFDEEESVVKGSISLILISQKNVIEMLEPAALSTFKKTNVIKCDQYTEPELLDILKQRVELAMKPGRIEDETVDLIADIAANEGNARTAIELLWKAGLDAEDNRQKKITPENVRTAKGSITQLEYKISSLALHEKYVLLAIARALKKGGAYAITSDVEKKYAVICEEYLETPRGHTQFWNYLKSLDAYNIINAKKSSKGVIGNTTLISMTDLPVKELEEFLVKDVGKKK
jgi:cell division control protein 6